MDRKELDKIFKDKLNVMEKKLEEVKMPRKESYDEVDEDEDDAEYKKKWAKKDEVRKIRDEDDDERPRENKTVQLVTENQLLNAKLDHIIVILEKIEKHL